MSELKPRDPIALFETAKAIIGAQIEKEHSLIWAIFTMPDFPQDSFEGYFSNKARVIGRDEPIKMKRIPLALPKGVNIEHVCQLIHCFVRDGYELRAFVFHPGKEVTLENLNKS